MKKNLLGLIALTLLPALTTHAELMVNYNNTGDVYDTGDDIFAQPSSTLVASDLDDDTAADDVTGFADDHTFSTSTAFNGASTAGYVGPDIFGAIRLQKLNATTVGTNTHSNSRSS